MAGNPGAVWVVRIVRGDHVEACGQTSGFRAAVTESAHEDRAGPIGQQQVKAAPGAGIENGDRGGGRIGGPVLQCEKRQFAAASLAGGRPQAARTVQDGGDHAVAVQAHPRAAPRTVATRDDARPIGPVTGWRIPCTVQHFIPIGGEHERPSMAGAGQDDDGAHIAGGSVGPGHTSQLAMPVNFRDIRRSDG